MRPPVSLTLKKWRCVLNTGKYRPAPCLRGGSWAQKGPVQGHAGACGRRESPTVCLLLACSTPGQGWPPPGGGPGWLLTTPVCPGATFEATTPCVVQSEAMAEASRRLLRHSDLALRPTPSIQVRAQVGTQLLLPTMSR